MANLVVSTVLGAKTIFRIVGSNDQEECAKVARVYYKHARGPNRLFKGSKIFQLFAYVP